MNFASEDILVAIFLTQLKVFFRRVTGQRLNRHYILTEFDSGYGVADIVLGSFAPYLSTRSLRSSIDSNWAGTLVDVLNEKPFSLIDFANKCGVSQQTAREKINQFVAAGFLKSKQQQFLKFKDYKVSVDTSIAIEAKLKNWKQALNQARRYKRFANYSYVLLDKQFSAPAEKSIHIFQQHNIGLISMRGHDLTIHHSPEQKDVTKNIYFYKLSEVVYDYFRETYGYSEESGSK
jgi:hypothetical protein